MRWIAAFLLCRSDWRESRDVRDEEDRGRADPARASEHHSPLPAAVPAPGQPGQEVRALYRPNMTRRWPESDQ